ncbi:MAG: aromatic ring-hydroxylating dioxygenase subunit alpha [Cyclobacteriaceae bacterium]
MKKEIQKAETLNTSFYQKPEHFESSKESIFSKSWQLIGHEGIMDDLSVYPFRFIDGMLDEPLILTKNNDKLLCMSNVCTHRGNLLAPQSKHVQKLVCNYHGRRFGLDGKFEYMPEFEGVEGFPRECDNLKNLPLYQWGPFLFTSIEPVFDFVNIIESLNNRIGFLDLHALKERQDLSKNYSVKAHWALYCDNYLEGFHIPFVHTGLNEVVDYSEYESVLYDYCNLQIGYGKNETECFDLPSDHPDFGKQVAAYYYWIFPNMMFNFYPWGLSINVVEPINLENTRIRYYTFVLDEGRFEGSAGADLNKVELEDEEIVENVQHGIKSRFYQTGRFSPKMEKGVHHFHQLISEFMPI